MFVVLFFASNTMGRHCLYYSVDCLMNQKFICYYENPKLALSINLGQYLWATLIPYICLMLRSEYSVSRLAMGNSNVYMLLWYSHVIQVKGCINVSHTHLYSSASALSSSHAQTSLVCVSIHFCEKTFLVNERSHIILALPEMPPINLSFQNIT